MILKQVCCNLSDFNDVDLIQVSEYVELEEIRHVEYVGPYMSEPDAEEFVEIVNAWSDPPPNGLS